MCFLHFDSDAKKYIYIYILYMISQGLNIRMQIPGILAVIFCAVQFQYHSHLDLQSLEMKHSTHGS